jgi:hypothetical protein
MNSIIEDISDERKQLMCSAGSWRDGCPVSLERLKIVRFSYYDFLGQECSNGELVDFDLVAPYIVNIFSALYEIRFPLSSIRPIEEYKADDHLSMQHNNSYSFCYRPIEGSDTLSLHSYGLAIDINPLYNPCIIKRNDRTIIQPTEGFAYVDRSKLHAGMVEPVLDIFRKNIFRIWGGEWQTPVDYHHFQVPRLVAQLLAIMNYDDGKRFIALYEGNDNKDFWDNLIAISAKLTELYKLNNKIFFDFLEKLISSPSSS